MTALARSDLPASPQSTCFCSRCGAESAEAARRVCESCEAGILLTCRSDALPGWAFLICTYELSITAVSKAGEDIFGTEEGLLGTHLLELATCPLGDDQLSRNAGLAARRPCDPVVMPVRLRSPEAPGIGMLAARIATCGPPRAALVTVEPSGFGRS